MQFNTPLLRGTLVKRYKRFLADVALDNGQLVTAHCPNTGAMTGCAIAGSQVFLSQHTNPKRKLPYTWELVVTPDGDWVGVNTHTANALVAEAIQTDKIKTFTAYDSLRREVKYGQQNSRVDLLLQAEHKPDCYIEVKSVTLKQGAQGYFPDAITTRGQKHLRELVGAARAGQRAVLLFCVQHSGINTVAIAAHIDPEYANLCRQAQQLGVEFKAVGTAISPDNITVNQELTICW